jgi:formylglycine-generating enzyme required for sulfatase activity
MSIARLAVAVSIISFAGAAPAQDLMLFPPETFGQVVAPRNESMLDVQLEAQVGSYNNEFVSSYGDRSIFARTGRAVGMLQILTNVGHAPCTAFLVEGNKLVTNHHCVPGILKHPRMVERGATSIAAVQFHAGFLRDGIEAGVKSFHVNPVPLETSEALDYTVLQVLGDANAEFGALELSAAVPNDRDPFWVIGHPMGEAQRISREKCQADSPALAGQRLRHTCDTLPGNSGSPVIDAGSQKVIGLHHAGSRAGDVNFAVPMAEILAQSKVLKAAVPVRPKPVEADTSELDAAFALNDAVTLEDADARIAALEDLVRAFSGTRAAKRAERQLAVERKALADEKERLKAETGKAPQPQAPTRTGSFGINAEAWLSGMPGEPGSVFKECNDCPEMVVIPAGAYMQGSPKSEVGRGDDEDQRRVTIPAPFAMGRYEVTFAEWDACAVAGNCRKDVDDGGWGRGTRPVMNVSWYDIRAFVRWMNSQVEGAPYRLPSEAEWEYAARAGTVTPFWWGSTISTKQANYYGAYVYGEGTKGEYRAKTLPVGSFDANPFGLYDVHGNVWEWVEDCYVDSYDNVSPIGTAQTTSGCDRRVQRGGPWGLDPGFLRSARRFSQRPLFRNSNVGFRLARTLTP